MKDPILALDVGGTNLRAAIIGPKGEIVKRRRICHRLSRLDGVNGSERGDAVVKVLTEFLKPLMDERIAAVGIGFPGFFRAQEGILISSPNLPGITNFPLRKRLEEALGRPTFIQNDALMAAWGEFAHGAGRGRSHLIHLTLGTGVGGGVVLDGRPYTGENGMAMEIGHVKMVSQGRRCGCGSRGCLEAHASAKAVAEIYGNGVDADEVFRRWKSGDPRAAKVLQDAGDLIGRAIAHAVNLLDVRTISIGGGLTGAWEALRGPIVAAVEAGVIPPHRGRIEVLRAHLGDDGALLGAASWVRSTLAS